MNEDKYSRAVSVCFSGHRIIPALQRNRLKQWLVEEITKAYADGYRIFYCGMAMGFDLLAAKAALSLKKELPELRIVAVVPYRDQTARWNAWMKTEYDAVLRSIDEVILLSEHYYKDCLLRRNDYMVSHSSRLIAWYDGKPMGGTSYTCRKARADGIRMINLYNN